MKTNLVDVALAMPSTFKCIRVRGGMMAMPNNQATGGNRTYEQPRRDAVDLTMKTLAKMQRNSSPTVKQTWYVRFVQGLADKAQDGFTMVSVAKGTHKGGHEWIMANNALPVAPNPPVARCGN